jgi:spore coat polysaccharide biosynthesis protein SpsF
MTADNPFPDIEELDRLINLHIDTKSDFTNSFDVLPVGVGVEIFTFKALEKSYFEGMEPHHIEHVNEYMIEHPDIFKTSILKVMESKNHPEIRLTVDTDEDYQRACYIVEQSDNEYIKTDEAIQLCLQFA